MIGHYFYTYDFFILMIGVMGRLALRVYGDDWALLYTYFVIVMIGVTVRLALHMYRADWALLYTYDF